MRPDAGIHHFVLEPWAEAELALERRCNVPEMTCHLGGVERDEVVVARHKRLLRLAETGTGRMFRVVIEPAGEPVGAVGYWERTWGGETVYEMGWKVLPRFQGRGAAATATAAAVAHARSDGRHRFAHAFPSADNAASNAVCRKVGFALTGPCDFEYPKGSTIRCNDWRLDLTAPA